VAAAVVASMVFTGCINEDDTYKKLQPVEKGINIYNWTSSQYSMATEQANIGLRMARHSSAAPAHRGSARGSITSICGQLPAR